MLRRTKIKTLKPLLSSHQELKIVTYGWRYKQSFANSLESFDNYEKIKLKKQKTIWQVLEHRKKLKGAAKPRPPLEPDPDDCCGFGCHPCIYDMYYDDLQDHMEEIDEWKLAQLEEN
mmetsp:Transcript_58842/g.67041  ORF Transcript_58842/g.67041 Transcript_58842/m.67041 type:complete len:117 (-) Transcript_58842:154-504(-)